MNPSKFARVKNNKNGSTNMEQVLKHSKFAGATKHGRILKFYRGAKQEFVRKDFSRLIALKYRK